MIYRLCFCWLAAVLVVGCAPRADRAVAEPDDGSLHFVGGSAAAVSAAPDPIPGEKIDPSRRWSLSDRAAVTELSGTQFGEQEINEFWTRKGWRMTKREELYLAQIAELEAAGAITPVSRWSGCPYATVYQTLQRVGVLGTVIDRGHEFILEMDQDDDQLLVGTPRFSRAPGYVEDHAEGHVTDSRKAPGGAD
ncbi:MAG: hypothetical protein JNL82_11440 [Myxococcales bacterium]|nr:hypothetical protein [Myxococcales bacterium]